MLSLVTNVAYLSSSHHTVNRDSKILTDTGQGNLAFEKRVMELKKLPDMSYSRSGHCRGRRRAL